jgi:hypothetical protein
MDPANFDAWYDNLYNVDLGLLEDYYADNVDFEIDPDLYPIDVGDVDPIYPHIPLTYIINAFKPTRSLFYNYQSAIGYVPGWALSNGEFLLSLHDFSKFLTLALMQIARKKVRENQSQHYYLKRIRFGFGYNVPQDINNRIFYTEVIMVQPPGLSINVILHQTGVFYEYLFPIVNELITRLSLHYAFQQIQVGDAFTFVVEFFYRREHGFGNEWFPLPQWNIVPNLTIYQQYRQIRENYNTTIFRQNELQGVAQGYQSNLQDYLAGYMYRCKPQLVYKMANQLGLFYNHDMDSGYCFVMAFIRAECREYIRDPVTNQFVDYQISRRMVEQFALFQSDVFPDTDTWIDVARRFHTFLERKMERAIDIHSYEETPQIYADIFQVNIHLYDSERKGRKRLVIPYTGISDAHVYIYIHQHHAHPVIHIKLFLQHINCFCDLCHTKMTTKIKWKQHVQKCYENGTVVSKHTKKFIEDMRAIENYPKYHKIPNCLYCYTCNVFAPYITCDHVEKYEEDKFVCSICLWEGKFTDYCKDDHICTMKQQSYTKELQSQHLWVIDIESMQNQCVEDPTKFTHTAVLICLRNIYEKELKFEFVSTSDFFDFLQSNPLYWKDVTFLAHNGGGYDYQFFIMESDKRQWVYDFIPCPNSMHKYLQVSITIHDAITIQFIDFMRLVPGSLRGIAKAFGLAVQKGDFPHRFLNETNLHYVGSIPPLDHPQDYFCLKTKKSEEEMEEMKEWYRVYQVPFCQNVDCNDLESCQCGEGKRRWDCQEELKKYCWLDVDVLAEAAKQYRSLVMNLEKETTNHWTSNGLDPFSCITQSQVAIRLLLSGLSTEQETKQEIFITRNLYHNSMFWQQFRYLYDHPEYDHVGNGRQKYISFLNYYCDGYCPETNEILQLVDCEYHGCPHCYRNRNENSTQRKYFTYQECYEQYQLQTQKLGMYQYKLKTIWKHDLEPLYQEEEDRTIGEICFDREFFYGGRTEVFRAYANASKLNQQIKYYDVCSLYPTVCAKMELPVGKPTIYFGREIDCTRLHPRHPEAYWGFAKVRVIPHPRDLLGLLPSKDAEGRLVFDLLPKTGFWHTEELYLAIEQGYNIEKVYQVIHFEPEKRSDTILKGYIEFWLRIKQECEGWKKLGWKKQSPDQVEPTEEEKDLVCEQVYERNGNMARPRKEKVEENKVLRQIAKIFLNCLWGKFCQKQQGSAFCDIQNYEDFDALIYRSGLDMNQMIFRQTSDCSFRVKYQRPTAQVKANAKYNIYLAASVTAHARTYLHRQMILLGKENILYCDTDSIICLRDLPPSVFLQEESPPPCESPLLNFGMGLGQWVDEHPEHQIDEFYATAPKCYMLKLSSQEELLKAKGVCLTLQNKTLLKAKDLEKLISAVYYQLDQEYIHLKNMTIYPNVTDNNIPYANMMTRYNSKIFRVTLTKRQMIYHYVNEVDENEEEEEEKDLDNLSSIQLYPFGYHHHHHN